MAHLSLLWFSALNITSFCLTVLHYVNYHVATCWHHMPNLLLFTLMTLCHPASFPVIMEGNSSESRVSMARRKLEIVNESNVLDDIGKFSLLII